MDKEGAADKPASKVFAPAICWKRVGADLKLSCQLIQKLDQEKGIANNVITSVGKPEGEFLAALRTAGSTGVMFVAQCGGALLQEVGEHWRQCCQWGRRARGPAPHQKHFGWHMNALWAPVGQEGVSCLRAGGQRAAGSKGNVITNMGEPEGGVHLQQVCRMGMQDFLVLAACTQMLSHRHTMAAGPAAPAAAGGEKQEKEEPAAIEEDGVVAEEKGKSAAPVAAEAGAALKEKLSQATEVNMLDLQLAYLWRVHRVNYYVGGGLQDAAARGSRLLLRRLSIRFAILAFHFFTGLLPCCLLSKLHRHTASTRCSPCLQGHT